MKQLCILLNVEYFVFKKHDVYTAIGRTSVCTVKLAMAAYIMGTSLYSRKSIWSFKID